MLTLKQQGHGATERKGSRGYGARLRFNSTGGPIGSGPAILN